MQTLSTLSIRDVIETINDLATSVALLEVLDTDEFRLVTLTPSMAALYNVKRNESVGRLISEFRFDKATRDRLLSVYRQCRDSKQAVTSEESVVRPDGETIWTSRTVAPVFDANGDVIACLATVTDISDLVATRRALLRSLMLAAGEFVSICSWCRNIRNGDQWIPVDEYLTQVEGPDARTDICPDCAGTPEGEREKHDLYRGASMGRHIAAVPTGVRLLCTRAITCPIARRVGGRRGTLT